MKNRRTLLGVLLMGAAHTLACGQGDGAGPSGKGGGSAGNGGTSAAGGSNAGGVVSTGGRATGGTTATGGNAAGGSTSTGGRATGGTTASGGSGQGGGGAGGSAGSGGNSGSGGAGPGGAGGSPPSGGNQGTGGNACATCTDAGASGGGGGGGAGTGGTLVGGAGGTAVGGSTGGLPPLKVSGTKLQDPNGKTIVLRGTSLIDIGALYVAGGNAVKGITDRIDKLVTAGVQGHTVRFPVYPKIDYNGGYPYCSDMPYPVGSGPTTSCTAKSPMTAADYVSKVLKPAVDYATGKNLYVIIDHHQIDDATKGNSAADAKAFWTDVAPKFASYSNVLYEPFNEPIDGAATWAQLKPAVQGWIDTIRTAGASNVIIVPSNSYCQPRAMPPAIHRPIRSRT